MRRLNAKAAEELSKCRSRPPPPLARASSSSSSSPSSCLSSPHSPVAAPVVALCGVGGAGGGTMSQELQHKCSLKDFLIKSLVEVVRTSSDLGPTAVVRHLREATYRPSYVRNLDFDLKSLCAYIETGNIEGEKSRRSRTDTLEKMVGLLKGYSIV